MSSSWKLRFQPTLECLEGRDAPSSLSSGLNSEVLRFAESHRGARVGDGQCSSLAIAALQAARCKTADDYGINGWSANYVWGALALKEIGGRSGGKGVQGNADEVQAGDVIQFSNVKFVTSTPTYHSWENYPHHTAIIEENLGGGRFKILHQNVNGRQTVQEGTIDFSHMTKGTVWVYHPVPGR